MGCTTSTRKKCRHCEAHYSPMRRSYSIQTVDPQQHILDSYHLLSLSSTNFNSFSFSTHSNFDQPINGCTTADKALKDCIRNTQDTPVMKRMIPKTPCMTPPGEPEVIDAWEIMEGLDDWSPLIKGLATKYHEDGSSKRIDDRILIVYFTSLRGVRKTYEECCKVKAVLQGMGVKIDERDVSMHSGFKEELRELLGEGYLSRGLPLVFIGKKFIGGAEEISRLLEEGMLEKMIEGCAKVGEGSENKGACLACGDIRFVPCETCYGSCKVFCEDEDDSGECRLVKNGEYGFHRCQYCNENGLVRCPICCL